MPLCSDLQIKKRIYSTTAALNKRPHHHQFSKFFPFSSVMEDQISATSTSKNINNLSNLLDQLTETVRNNKSVIMTCIQLVAPLVHCETNVFNYYQPREDLTLVVQTFKKTDLPRSQITKTGKWTQDEQHLFLQGINKFGRNSHFKIAQLVKTRTSNQVRSHSQSFFKRKR